MLIILSLVTMNAFADGGCAKARPTTPAEKAAYKRLVDAVKPALPPAPAGWKIVEDNASDDPGLVCLGSEQVPLVAQVRRKLIREAGVAKQEAEVGKAIEENAKSMEAGQAEADKLQEKIGVIAEKLGAAAERGDQAEVERLQKEMERLQRKMTAGAVAGNERLEAVEAKTGKDTSAEVTIEVNSGQVSVEGCTKTAVAGAAYSCRRKATSAGEDSEALVLLGRWKAEGEWFRLPGASGLAVTGGHTAIVTVQADGARLDSLLKSVNLGAVKAALR